MKTGIPHPPMPLKRLACTAIAILLISCGGGSNTSPPNTIPPNTATASSSTLQINPIAQETPVWCWAAAAEMIFKYYSMPGLNLGNYQCGIVAAYYGGPCIQSCANCVVPIGGMNQMQVLVNGYGVVANQFGIPSRILSSQLLFSALTMDKVKEEIDAGRPILAGISPNGVSYPNFSQHVVVIVGYEQNATTNAVVVNDPFPYAAAFLPDPYFQAGAIQLKPGQYKIAYSRMLSPMNWANSIYQVR